jgi:hypothetical protein
MRADTERALQILDEALRTVPAHEVIDLDHDYRHLIAAVEALPENQPGADKSWVWARYAAYRDHFRVAEPKGPWIRSRATPDP